MAFIGIDREIESHWIYTDAEYFKVWFEILLRARYSEEPEKKLMDGKFITVEYGQFIFGRVSWSNRLKIGERRLRTLFDKLVADGMIELIAKNPKFTIYSVKNYAKYNANFDQQSDQRKSQAGQRIEGVSDQQGGQHPTSTRPAPDQHPTTQEQGSNKDNKDNKEKIKEIVLFLNQKTGKRFSEKTEATKKSINARLNEGYTVDDFRKVITIKTGEWLNDAKMNQYLCPDTLFRPGNFEKYLNQEIGGRANAIDRRNIENHHSGVDFGF